MDNPTQIENSAIGSLKGGQKRVRSACERCRRQKLKCDNVRPCALCVRSRVECAITSRVNEVGDRAHLRRRERTNVGGNTARTVPVLPFPDENTLKRFEVGILKDSIAGYPLFTPSKMTSMASNPVNNPQDFGLRHHSQGSSVIGLTKEIFDLIKTEPENDNETFALPGGTPSSDLLIQRRGANDLVSLHEMIGIDLPPKHVTDFLIQTYLDSVHWFMMIFHEPSFRQAYENIITSRSAPRYKKGFVVLMMMVLAMGSRYATKETAQANCPEIDQKALQTLLLGKVKEFMFDVYDEARIEAVQVSILLASFYMYNARPNLAFAVLGACIKSAQAIGLHRESTWKGCSQIAREVRRRTWWTIYTFDRFSSVVYGRPCTICDFDCEVGMVQNIDDTSARHPVLQSLEKLEDGTVDHVTIFTYQRLKFRLYQAASPLIGNIYFLRGVTKSQIIERVGKIHQDLLEWFASIPAELRLVDGQPKLTGHSSRVEKTFKLQALALQLAYDNIQILLHRPLLSMDSDIKSSFTFTGTEFGQSAQQTSNSNGAASATTSALLTSKAQCWESALRTSRVVNHVDILRIVKNTQAAAYTGIQMFTAGILLSVVALSQPFSPQAQEAKQAIAQIIRLSKALGNQTILSAQSSKILEDIIRIILKKEMKELLTGGNMDAHNDDMLALATHESSAPSNVEHHWNGIDHSSMESSRAYELGGSPKGQMDHGGLVNGPFVGDTDFNEGLMSLQEILQGNSRQFTQHETSSLEIDSYEVDTGSDSIPLSTGNTDPSPPFFSSFHDDLNDSSQMWFWDMNSSTF